MLIGVDVGATTTAGGLVTLDGQVLSVIQVPTHRRGPETGVETLLEVVGHLLAEARARGLGLDPADPLEKAPARDGRHDAPQPLGPLGVAGARVMGLEDGVQDEAHIGAPTRRASRQPHSSAVAGRPLPDDADPHTFCHGRPRCP